jgi:hypothetical protein
MEEDRPAEGGAAAAAAQQQPQQLGEDGRPVRPVFNDAHTVFVKGMGFQLVEDDLKELFGDVEGLKEVRLARDHDTNAPRVSAGIEGSLQIPALSCS